MAINVATSFNVQTNLPIDERLVLSKEQMININDNVMPESYIATCTDDGCLYIYNKTNNADPLTGKFRKVNGNEIDIENYISYDSDAYETISEHTYDIQDYTDTEIEDMFTETPEQLAELSKIINDNVTAQNKLWSSKNVSDKITAAILESNAYADGLIADLVNIELIYVTELPDSANSNQIYILSGTPATLNLWDTTKSEWIVIGNFEPSMDDYYTKSEADTLLAAKANSDSVVSTDAIVQNLDNPSGTEVLSTFALNNIVDGLIDDDSTSEDSTWSSSKINNKFNSMHGYTSKRFIAAANGSKTGDVISGEIEITRGCYIVSMISPIINNSDSSLWTAIAAQVYFPDGNSFIVDYEARSSGICKVTTIFAIGTDAKIRAINYGGNNTDVKFNNYNTGTISIAKIC